MKKIGLILFLIFTSVSGFASHPHDQICVGSVKVGALPVSSSNSFVLQFAWGRTYLRGSGSDDVHAVNISVRVCDDDYGDERCSVYEQKDILIDPLKEKSNGAIKVELKKSQGELFFNGNLLNKNNVITLTGDTRFVNDSGEVKLINTISTLTCVNQPWLDLKAKADDGM